MAAAARKWHPEDIKAEVRKRSGTLTGIARKAQLSDAACRVAFIKPLPTANRAIADFINVPVFELWPDWFDAQGNRKPSNSTAKNSLPAASGHRQKRGAK